MEDAPKLLKIPKSECPDIWIRLPRHKWPKSWSSMEGPVVPLERNLYGHPLAGLLWEKQFEKILLKCGWEKVSNWECLYGHREKKRLFLSVYVDDIKLARKKQNIDQMWKVLNKEVDFGRTNIFPGSCLFGLHSTRMRNEQRCCGQLQTMFESRISAGATKNYHARKICVFLHGLTTRKGMPRNAWNDVVSWPTRPLNNSTKYQLHALMTTISKKKN